MAEKKKPAKKTPRKKVVKVEQELPDHLQELLDARADQTNWRKKMQQSKIGFTDKKKEIYVALLAEYGRKGIACEGARVHRHTVKEHMENDPDFALACIEAETAWGDKLISHARNIMLEGEKTINYDKEGNVTSETVRYPQPLIALEMKKQDEGYKDKPAIEIGNIGGGVLVAPPDMTPNEWLEHQDTKNNQKPDHAPDRSKALEDQSK